VLDVIEMTWSCPNIRGKKPSGRFGHSQVFILFTCFLIQLQTNLIIFLPDDNKEQEILQFIKGRPLQDGVDL